MPKADSSTGQDYTVTSSGTNSEVCPCPHLLPLAPFVIEPDHNLSDERRVTITAPVTMAVVPPTTIVTTIPTRAFQSLPRGLFFQVADAKSR